MKRHNWRLLQQEWLEGGHQTLLEFAAAVKVPASTVEKYAAKHRWKQKGKEAAILIEEQAEQKFIESVSDRIAKARQKHVKIGEILQDKGLRSLAKAENLDAGQAITAIRAGVDIERKGLGIDEARAAPQTYRIIIL